MSRCRLFLQPVWSSWPCKQVAHGHGRDLHWCRWDLASESWCQHQCSRNHWLEVQIGRVCLCVCPAGRLSARPSHFVSALPGVILLGSWSNLVGVYLGTIKISANFVRGICSSLNVGLKSLLNYWGLTSQLRLWQEQFFLYRGLTWLGCTSGQVLGRVHSWEM